MNINLMVLFLLSLFQLKGLANQEEKFRLKKYNEIWLKAQDKVPKNKLEKLGHILSKLDKQELDLKHQKHGSSSYNIDHEASLQTYLHQVLVDYGIINPDTVNYSDLKFQDQRLQELWHKAVHDADYTREDLAVLKQEFEHIEGKLKETHDMHQILETHDEQLDHKTPVEQIKKMKHLRKDFKNSHHDVNEMLINMGEKIESRKIYMGDDPEKRFTDKRILDLWDSAKTSGKFSPSELDSVKDELMHFQTRVHKLNYWQRVGDNLRAKLKEENNDALRDEYEHSKRQITEHKKFIKKYHATVQQRIKSEL